MWHPGGPASLTPGLACHPQFARPPAPIRSQPTLLSSLYSGHPGRVRTHSSLSRCAQSRWRRSQGDGCWDAGAQVLQGQGRGAVCPQRVWEGFSEEVTTKSRGRLTLLSAYTLPGGC